MASRRVRPPPLPPLDRVEQGIPIDRRVKRVYLTEKIGPLLRPLEQIVEELGNATTKGLTQAEKESFAGFLAVAYENLLAVTEEDLSDAD